MKLICQTVCRNEKRVSGLVTYIKTIAKSQENPFLGFCCSLLFRIFLKLRPDLGRSLGGLLGRQSVNSFSIDIHSTIEII